LCTITLGGEGVFWILSDRDDRMGAKIKNPKNPWGFKQFQKFPGPNFNPQNISKP